MTRRRKSRRRSRRTDIYADADRALRTLGQVKPSLRGKLAEALDAIHGHGRYARTRTAGRKTADGSWSVNAATTPVDEARAFAEKKLQKSGLTVDQAFEDFDRNYTLLQKKTKKALDIPRYMMPVIEPEQIDDFMEDIRAGRVDIFRPWAKGELYTPDGGFGSKEEAEEWINLGMQDGATGDDPLNAKLTSAPCAKLLPTQSQIWFDKLIHNVNKFGPVDGSSPILDMTIIISKDGYLLDGHHRWSGALLADPSLSMSVLHVPLDIQRLVDISRSYGYALGNEPKH